MAHSFLGEKSERFFEDGYDFSHCRNKPEDLREHPTAVRMSKMLSRKSAAEHAAEGDGDAQVMKQYGKEKSDLEELDGRKVSDFNEALVEMLEDRAKIKLETPDDSVECITCS